MAVGSDEAVTVSRSDGGRRARWKWRVVPATIVELLPAATYRLKLENEQEVLSPCGRAATMTNFVRLRPGDRVEVELSLA